MTNVLLQRARARAGLTQRALAARAGVPQSTVARIERGRLDPRISTLDRLLRACGVELDVVPRPGAGVDRTQIRERLALSPEQRLKETAAAAAAVGRLRRAAAR